MPVPAPSDNQPPPGDSIHRASTPEGKDSPSLPPAIPPEALRAALECIENEGIAIEVAAVAFGIPVETLHRWQRAENRHSVPADSTASPDAIDSEVSAPPLPPEEEGASSGVALKLPSMRESGKRLEGDAKESFQGNWERSAPLETEIAPPSALALFCARSALLRWLVRDGKMEPTITVGAFILLAAGAAFGIAAAGGAFSPKPSTANVTEAASGDENDPVSLKTQKAREVILAFLGAENWQAQLPFVRDPDSAAPLMEAWAANGHPPLPRNLKFVFLENIVDFPERQFLHFTAHSDIGAKPRDIIVDTTAEPYKVDWQATVIHQPMDWETFVHERPPGEFHFRVFAELSDYYNFEFTDSTEYLALKVTAPDCVTSVYAYVRRSSELGKRLSNIFVSQGATAQPVVRILASLSFADIPPQQDTVHLMALVSTDWMVP